jgi:hypothetical protein
VVCRPKNQGGLGIQDFEVKNTALLEKWLFKSLTQDRVWQTLLRGKSIGLKALSHVFGNLVTHTFGPDSWQRRSIFWPWNFFD